MLDNEDNWYTKWVVSKAFDKNRDILLFILEFTRLCHIIKTQKWYYFRSVGYKNMSITLNFGSDFFAENISDFETARRNYVNRSSTRRKESKLPLKVKMSETKYDSTKSFRSMQLLWRVLKWLIQMFFFLNKIPMIHL